MVRIEYTEQEIGSDPRTPDKRYADTLWQANPRLSPDWWHEALGYTVGKIALDWRKDLTRPDALREGCSLILTSPARQNDVAACLRQQAEPEAYVNLVVTEAPQAEAFAHATGVVWQPAANLTEAERVTVLEYLEHAVREGRWASYGVVCQNEPPLHVWLNDANLAAARVWGRKKRAALRWVVVEQDLLHLEHILTPSTFHRDEAVSTVELASRLGLAVIVVPLVLPKDVAPPAEALAALTHAATCEAALNQALGGWPHVGGQPLFSVLASLGQGQVPWPTPHVWQAWQQQVWPQLWRTWQTLLTPENREALEPYMQALQGLEPHGKALATAAAQPLLAKVLEEMRPRLMSPWPQQPESVQTLAVLASLPAVTAVAIADDVPLTVLRETPGLPDIAAVLAASR